MQNADTAVPPVSFLNSEFCILHYVPWHKDIDPTVWVRRFATS